MIERSYGILEGKFHKTVIAKYGKKQSDIWHRSYAVSLPGGESIMMVEKKSFVVYKRFDESHEDGKGKCGNFCSRKFN